MRSGRVAEVGDGEMERRQERGRSNKHPCIEDLSDKPLKKSRPSTGGSRAASLEEQPSKAMAPHLRRNDIRKISFLDAAEETIHGHERQDAEASVVSPHTLSEAAPDGAHGEYNNA